jgi:polyhydroxyalkanoate synthesis regulator phasin
MFDDIKKGIFTGLGVVLLTKEKVEEISRKMVDDAKLSKDDARKLQQELLSSGERQWEQIAESLTEAVKKGLKGLDIGSGKDVDELGKRVENLEKRIALLEEIKDPEG